MQKIQYQVDITDLDQCNNLNQIAGRFRRQIIQSFWAGLLYTIWRQTNETIWKQVISRPDIAIHNMISEVHHRISYVLPRKTSANDRNWFMSLYRTV